MCNFGLDLGSCQTLLGFAVCISSCLLPSVSKAHLRHFTLNNNFCCILRRGHWRKKEMNLHCMGQK